MDAALAIATISALASAVAAGFAAWTALLMRRQMRFEAGAEVMDRFNQLNDELCQRLGPPPDGLDPTARQLAVELLSLYERGYSAHESGVLDLDQWVAATTGFNYWIRREELLQACQSLLAHDDAWQPGFVAFVRASLDESPSSSQERLHPDLA